MSHIPSVETFNIQQVEITNSEFNSIVDDFEESSKMFEYGVNSLCENEISYFTFIESFCKNDSSFVTLTVISGSYFFFGTSNEIDRRFLNQLFLVKGKKGQLLISKDLNTGFCSSSKKELYEEVSSKKEFKLESYKNQDGDWIIELNPFFFEIYYIDDRGFTYIDRLFPKQPVEVKN